MPIVWSFPDGHIELTTITERVLQGVLSQYPTKQEAVLAMAKGIAEKAPHLNAAVPTLVASKNVPKDRSRRAQWKLVGDKIEA